MRPFRPSLRFQVEMVVIVFLVIGATAVVGNALAASQVSQDRNALLGVWRPAQAQASDLSNAFIDQATAELGYVATGLTSYLDEFHRSNAAATKALDQLRQDLAGDPKGTALVDRVSRAAHQWDTEVAQPAVALRANGPIAVSPPQLARAEAIFQDLQNSQEQLSRYINNVVDEKVRADQAAQSTATWFSIGAGIAAALAALAAFLILRFSLSRPLERLVQRVEATSKDPSRPIVLDGPPELNRIAQAGETMRLGILDHTAREAEANERLALAAEDERIARDLHDTVIQNLYATGLVLRSKLDQLTAADAQEAVDHIDLAIRTLRTVIFELGEGTPVGGLRERVLTIVEESQRSLGFAPAVRFSGAVDTATSSPAIAELSPVLRESLSNVARHARATSADVVVEVDGGWLRLLVIDDGVGLPGRRPSAGRGLTNMVNRAKRLGGHASVSPGHEGGTVVEWRVPALGPSIEVSRSEQDGEMTDPAETTASGSRAAAG